MTTHHSADSLCIACTAFPADDAIWTDFCSPCAHSIAGCCYGCKRDDLNRRTGRERRFFRIGRAFFCVHCVVSLRGAL